MKMKHWMTSTNICICYLAYSLALWAFMKGMSGTPKRLPPAGGLLRQFSWKDALASDFQLLLSNHCCDCPEIGCLDQLFTWKVMLLIHSAVRAKFLESTFSMHYFFVIACPIETYGSNCKKNCSARHCKLYSGCFPSTGECVGGCQEGWTGIDCNTANVTQSGK